MLRKFTLFALSLLCVFNLMAQSNNDRVRTKALPSKSIITYPASDVQFWCGSGTNSAIIVVGFDDATTPVAYVWGVRFNGSAVVTDLFDSIMAYDSRVSYTMSGSLLTEFTFNNGADTPTGYSDWWCYKKDDQWCTTYDAQTAVDGDVFVMSTDCSWTLDLSDAIPVTDPNPSTPAETTVNAANPDTTLVDYWCGTGSNKAVVVIGWDDATPATALCWGVRWNGNTTAMGALDSIVAHDSHFTYAPGGMISNLAYNNGTLNLTSPTDWWCYTRNGAYAGAYASQQITNNDVLRLSATCTQSLPTATVVPNPNPGVNPPSHPTPTDATIAESDILYWVGSGSNSARFIVNWADTCLAWGYHFSTPTVNLETLMNDLTAADSRLSYVVDWGFVDNITFTENGTTHGVSNGHYFFFNKNGVYSQVGFDMVNVANGDYIKFGDEAVSTWLDSTWYGTYWMADDMLWQHTVYPVSAPAAPLPVDASIPASDILYWVGTGSNEVRFFVSYAEPDTCLAWGYRFSTPTITASQMVTDIVAADPRLSIDGDPSYVGDIFFTTDNGDTLKLSPVGDLGYNFWWTIKNGTSAMNGIGELLANGDYFKYGDMNSAQCADPEPDFYCLEEVWTTTPVPVPVPSIIIPEAVEADIANADILYWVGSGSNSARLIINWADPDTALAWGYRFSSDSVSVSQMISDIAAADPRLTMDAIASVVTDLVYTDGATTLQGLDYSYWMYNVNGEYAPDYMNNIYLHSGDMAKFGDMESATVLTWDYGYPATFVWEHAVTPVSVPLITPPASDPEEATIAESDILFWIGQGIHNYTLIVNWADTALAWGYRSWIDSVSVKEVMDQVMVNDPRFSYVAAGGFVNDIYFVENGDTLAITPGQYWSYNVNGSAAQNLYTSQYLHDHDMAKWGDPSVAVVLDSSEWGGVWYPTEQVWTMTVHPASVVEPEHGPFCGAVGSEGCNAVPATDNTIVAWAAACTLDLGYQNISAQGPRVSYGEAADAVGACDLDDNLSVVSLGDGGSATLTFDGHIYNGDGPDFAVYENGFDDSFLELAFVEVSSDGEHFVRFPATSLTQTTVQVGGIGTVDPTNINNLAGKYRHGWGTPFDLDDLRDSANLDINHITHVRIVDVVGSIDPQYASYDAFGHIVNDPWPTESYSSGFDLDGVAVMHLSNETESIDETVAEISLYPNPANDRVRISYGMGETFTAIVYDLSGREVMTRQGSGVLTLNVATLPGGVYMVRIADQVQKLVVRH